MKNIIRKSSLLAVCASVLFVAGCDKDSGLPSCVPGLNCFLKSATHTSTDDGTTDLEFIYGSDGKVSGFEVTYTQGQNTSVTTYTATHDGNGRISQFDGSDGSRFEYTYDANGKLTRDDTYGNAELAIRTEYEYNSAGQLIREDTYGGNLAKWFSEIYEYANASGSNPIRSRSLDGSGTALGYYTEYEYDDHPTPYTELHIPLGLSGSAGAPTNNVTRRTTKNSSGAVENTTTFTYQYNDDCYPTSLEYTMTFPTSPNTYTDTQTFTYDCK